MRPDLWITGCYGHQTKVTKIKKKIRSEVKLKLFIDNITVLLAKYVFFVCKELFTAVDF